MISGQQQPMEICRVWGKDAHAVAELRHLSKMIRTDQFMTKSQRQRVAVYLLLLATNPTALAALQGTRAGRPHTTHRDYKIATDYEATYERLGKAEATTLEIQEAWNIKRSTIKGALRKYRDNAHREIHRLALASPDLKRGALLKMISKTLRSPGNSTE
jgi:hypothetical protein